MTVPSRNRNRSVMVGTHSNTRVPQADSPVGDSPMVLMWRGRWIILLATVAGLAGAFVYLTKATPIYTSTSRIYVEQSGPRILTEMERGVMTQSQNFLYTQVELLTSLPILVEVLNDPGISQMRTFAGSVNPAARLKMNLQAKVGRRSDIINVSFDSPYPDEAARLVNAVVQAYITYHATHKRSTSAEVLRILQRESADRLEELSAKRQAMADFKQQNKELAFASDGGNIIMERLNRLSSELTEAQLATIESESAYEHAKEMLADPATLKQFVDVQRAKGLQIPTDDQYTELSNRLSEFELRLANRLREVKSNHPAVKALEVEITNLRAQLDTLNTEFAQAHLALAQQEYLTAKDKENKIDEQYADQCRQALELSWQVDQYEVLRLDWEQTRTLCDTLSNRIRELSVTEDIGALNISILEVARPANKPSKPQKSRVLAIALMMSLLTGGGLTVLRAWLDQRLRSAEEIGAVLGTPVLGVVPSMPRRLGIVRRGQKVHRDSGSPEAEAYRTIRTATFFGIPKDEAKRILVTSPTPGDGKTTLVSNLAIAMAQAGQRTLIIDADLRAPTQQKIFEMNHKEAGLSSVIAGRTTLEEAIRPSGIAGLDLLLAGPQVANPSEILNSDSFAQLLAILADKYDRIIVDSPPVMSVTDAQVVAAACDVSLLVLRAEKSTRSVSLQARDALLSVGANVLGAIVNDAKKRGRYRSYGVYGHYQGVYGRDRKRKARIHDSEPALVLDGFDSYRRMKRLPARACTPLNQRSQDLLEVIKMHTRPRFGSQIDGHEEFTRKDCETWTGLSRETIRHRLESLVDAGMVEVDRCSRPYKYKVADRELTKTADADMPSSGDIFCLPSGRGTAPTQEFSVCCPVQTDIASSPSDSEARIYDAKEEIPADGEVVRETDGDVCHRSTRLRA
ncbi:MAG: polysaccharide biosynthesis tyrosine autokinase [Phycisphaerales bacterium]|nr:MAG: polysaccharide biosynthesis tyrosine autokinase [Phycisphaerales bacterium]